MGLYDRDYGRDDAQMPWEQYERQQQRMQPKSAVIVLMVVTIGIFLADLLLFSEKIEGTSDRISRLANWFATRHDTLIQPWTWFQFLTYGFIHDTQSPGARVFYHVGFNMLGLYIFGRSVEQRLGRAEFVRFYLLSMFIGGVVGSATFWVTGEPLGSVIGASGAVLATTILFAFYYPNATLLLMFVLPVKAWVLAVVFVAYDLIMSLSMIGGALTSGGEGPQVQGGTAFTVHLAGAAFGALYYKCQWNLQWMDVTGVKSRMAKSARRTKLKIHDPDKKIAREEEEADRILEKIHRSGEESLTASERKTLERYSKRKRENRLR